MALSDRIGWRTYDGLNLIDDKGVKRHIKNSTPAAWKLLLRQAVQRRHESKLGLKTRYPEPGEHRVCVDLVRRISRSTRATKEGARLLVANAYNAV